MNEFYIFLIGASFLGTVDTRRLQAASV